ncbi:MAG: PKD domain-containing protein [Bacteroidota bacterium]
MKTLKNILLSVLLLAAYNTANAQCQIPIWASPSGPNVQFNWGYDSTNTLASWYWDFGDGDTSHSFNVEHTYAQSGVYNYCLHYTGTPCSGDTCGTVTVDVCDFNPYITYSGNYLTIAFEIYNPTAGASYSWTILDDSNNTLFTSTQPAPQFTFSGYNVYHVASVVVTLPNGCVDSSQTGFYVPNPCDAHVFHYNIDTAELAFYAWPQDSMGVTQFTYSWDFGDGTSDNTQNPTHNFGGYGTWNVCMIVTGPTCTDTVCESITLAPPPPPTPDCPSWIYLYPNGADVQFYGDLDSLNFASSFQWNFGDGNISNSPNPAHTYQSGSYIVCLNYTDSVCNVSICDSLTIDVCNFNPQFNYNTSGNTVTFAPTNPQSGSSYTWFFYSPNGALLDSSNLQNPQFTFPGYGSFPVALQVTLQNGCTDSSLTWIYFSNPCEAYISSYRIDSTSFQFYSFPFDSVNTNYLEFWRWNYRCKPRPGS